MSISPTVRLSLALALLLAGGCRNVDDYEVTALTIPPLGGGATRSAIEVVEGTAIGVRILLFDGSSLILPKEVTFKPDGAEVTLLQLNDEGHLFVSGAAVGSTTIEAHARFGKDVSIPVTVLPQPAQ